MLNAQPFVAIHLDAHLEAEIRQKVDAGLYSDVEDVIREAPRLLDEHDYERVNLLRAKLAVAEEQADRGEGRPLTPGLWAEFKCNARRKAAAGHRPNPDVSS